MTAARFAHHSRRLSMVLVLAALVLAGCQQKGEVGKLGHKSPIGIGGITAHGVWPESSLAKTSSVRQFNSGTIPSIVTQVRLTVQGDDFDDMSQTFDVNDRTGVIQGVPVGSNRTLIMDALNASSTIVYSGSTTGITVAAGVTTDAGNVTLSLVGSISGSLSITTPAMPSPYYSNDSVLNGSDQLTVSGACTSSPAHTVRALLGGVEKATAPCTAGSYTLLLPAEATDSTYLYSFQQVETFTGSVTGSLGWTWVLDNFQAPVVLGQSSATTGAGTTYVSGTCESGATVSVARTAPSAGTPNTATCASNAFSISTTEASDGTYTFDVIQTDLAGNDSAAVVFTRTVDSAIPFTPSISIPAGSASSQSALAGMTFTCETSEAHTVKVLEDGIQIIGQSCSASPLAVTFSGATTQGAHTYAVTQTRDLTGVGSAAASITWTKDNTAPSAPTIASPVVVAAGGTYTGPLATAELSITITGACETGSTVTRSGGTTADDTVSCSGGAYSITASGNDVTSYALTITQADAAGNGSGATTLNWRPDATVPATPVITGPGSNPYYANSLTTISGTCTTGLTVNLTGDASGSQTCSSTSGGTFSFSFSNPSPDGTYNYSVTQTDVKTSAAATLTFNRDTAVIPPGITSPASSPVTTALSSITINGTCEANGTVNVTGAAPQSLTCTSGGTFTLTDNQTTDNAYTYTFTQTDLAGNTSTSSSVTWNRVTVPPPPVITLPAAEPYYSNSLLTTLSGTCLPGLLVTLSGADTGTTTCSGGGTFSFSLAAEAANNTYVYSVTQTDSGTESSPADRTWTYDTGVPAAVGLTSSIITSNNGSINIAGTCETGTMVYLTDITGGGAGNQSTLCVGGAFSFTVSQSTTGTFTYEVSQTDAANNSSTAATQQWNRPAPGYTVSPQTNLSVSETGTTAQFTVVLQSTPNGDVVVNVASSDATEGSVDKSSLTFTTGNWSVAQTVTVTGLSDSTADGNQTFQINLTTNVGSTADTTGYKLINPANIQVTNSDIDAPGITVSPTSGLVVSESGTTATFSVVLNTSPSSGHVVVINVASQDTSEITLDKSTLTFNDGNWSTPQVVTLTGVDDVLDDGNQNVTIAVTLNSGLTTDTTGYAALNPADVTAMNSDNDTAGFTVTPTTGLVTTEGGGKATFTVNLNTSPNPGEVVVIDVVSQDTSEVSSDKSTLTFTSLDWYVPQTVTLTGVDDASVDGNQSTTIALTVNTTLTTDTTGYAALNPPDPAVINTDNDVVGVTVTPTTLTTSENGSEAEFSVRLNTQPTGNVVILVNNGDFSEISVDKTTLTFTAADWQTPQYVRATGVSDALADGNILVNIQLIIDTTLTTDSLYDPLDPADVSVTNLDNTDAVTVTPTSGLQTTDAGGTAQFTVVLNTQPDLGTQVVVNVLSLTTAEVTSDKSTLTFDNTSWSTPQTVTLTGHATSGASQVVTIQLTVDSAATTFNDYDAIDPTDVTVTNLHSGVYEVVVTPTSGLVTSESGGSATFNVSLTSAPASDVTITITSNDTTEVTTDKSTLTFTSGDWNTSQTVTAKGVNDTLTDGDIATTITVATSSADPNYTGIADQTVNVTNTDNDPNSQGTSGAPLNISASLPASASAGTSGTSYYLVTGLTASTAYFVTVSSMVMDNDATFTFEAFQTLAFMQAYVQGGAGDQNSECTGTEGEQNSGDARPKTCTATSSSTGELYIRAYNSSATMGATFQVDVVTVPVNEGATGTGNQVVLPFSSLPYDLGQVGATNSYYEITGVPAGSKMVRLTNMTENLGLRLYTSATFATQTTPTCSSDSSSIAESCIVTSGNNPGTLYVRVACSTTSPNCTTGGQKGTFTLDVIDVPVAQGTAAAPVDITGQIPYGGTAISPGSFYVISGLTPGTLYSVSMTEVTGGGGLEVYSDSTFSTLLCSQDGGVNLPESCPNATYPNSTVANSSGRLYIKVTSTDITVPATGTTFNIRIQ